MAKPSKTKASLQEVESGELTRANGNIVPFTVVHGWDARASRRCDVLWGAAWLDMLNRIDLEVSDESRRLEITASISGEDSSWRWFEKARRYSTDEYEWFHLYADNKPQAACVIYHPKPGALGPGNIFYVEYLAVAPWNQRCDHFDRQFGGLGTVVLRAAQRFAVSRLGLRPGFCLHSLETAEGFYTRLNMVSVTGREDGGLRYFELPQALAVEFMEAC